MIRMSDLSEEELLKKEDDWWEREDETDINWIMEGKKIFIYLLRFNRKEIRYRETLSYLILMQGEDLKLRQNSYKEATRSFNEVVRLDPENARAHYRLGFLYFYQKEWVKSIDSFQQSLHCSPRQSRNRLEKQQQVKAHYYILKATQIISKEFLKKVVQLPAEDLKLFGEIHHLLKELRATEQQDEKPYQMIVNGTDFSEINEREYEELSDPFENKNCLILNQRTMNDVVLSLNGNDIPIPTKQVPLLEFLMRHPEGVRREEIIERRYRDSRDPNGALRRSISRLRERLEPFATLQDLIQTIDGGYRWNSLYEFRMFKHTRDVSTDLLLD